MSVGIVFLVVCSIWAVLHFLFRHRLTGLERDLESEKEESTRLRGRLSEFEQKAGRTPEEAHARIESLERRVAQLGARRLEPEEKDQLVAALASTPAVILLQYAMGTPDGIKFVQDFEDVFRRANWELKGNFIIGGPQSEHGMSVIMYRNSPPFQILKAVLSAANFEYGIWDQTDVEDAPADVGLLISPWSG